MANMRTSKRIKAEIQRKSEIKDIKRAIRRTLR